MRDCLTIIIPYYCTDAALFQRCISSVLVNDVENYEILVVDDGSPEAYQTILDEAETNERVRVIRLPHCGVSAARNRGMKEAKGEWITFIDSDDFVNPIVLREILKNIASFNGDMELFSGGSYRDGIIRNNTTFLKEGYDYGQKQEDKIAIMDSALSVGIFPTGYKQYFTLGSPCCKLIRKAIIDYNQLTFNEDVKFAEDVLFMLHVYQAAGSIFYHDRYLYSYVVNSQSATRRYRPGLSNDMDVFFEKTREFLEKNGLSQMMERAYYARAQFEVRRSIALEFFHPENKSRCKRKQYIRFIRQEPYKTALKRQYLPRYNFNHRLYWFILEKGYIQYLRKLMAWKNR